jgi:hypothetical protein
MIQLNLLPDVKLEYIKTKKTKRMVVGVSLIVIGASVGLFILMFSFVNFAQKNHISKIDKDTEKYVNEIKNTEGVNEVLTIQNQLLVLDPKHQEKPATERILPYLEQVKSGAQLTTITVNFEDNTMQISGKTSNLDLVNKIVDTMKFATYVPKSEAGSENSEATKVSPYTDVVLESYAIDDETKEASFEISLKFDPKIFSNTEEVVISIPNTESTRSNTEKPKLDENGDNNGQ